jgi:hypothetical protein
MQVTFETVSTGFSGGLRKLDPPRFYANSCPAKYQHDYELFDPHAYNIPHFSAPPHSCHGNWIPIELDLGFSQLCPIRYSALLVAPASERADTSRHDQSTVLIHKTPAFVVDGRH